MDDPASETPEAAAKSLSAAARRVLAVLVEKAKTTPNGYPLTVAAVVTGSNQKSARNPVMSLTEGDALVALDELRAVGAATEIQGSGRTSKYRHNFYDWLDVDGPRSAVLTELLLRGPQTAGELRSRAGRMHTFESLEDLSATLRRLVDQGWVREMTPAGRGQLFAHTLYTPAEVPHVNARVEKQPVDAPERPPAATEPPLAQVDALLARLETVNARIDALESRVKALEE